MREREREREGGGGKEGAYWEGHKQVFHLFSSNDNQPALCVTQETLLMQAFVIIDRPTCVVH